MTHLNLSFKFHLLTVIFSSSSTCQYSQSQRHFLIKKYENRIVWNWVAKLHRLAGRYGNHMSTWFLAATVGLKLPTLVPRFFSPGLWNCMVPRFLGLLIMLSGFLKSGLPGSWNMHAAWFLNLSSLPWNTPSVWFPVLYLSLEYCICP